MYKIRLQIYFLKLAANGKSDKAFLLTLGFCPQRVVGPSPRKNIKKIAENENSKRFVWNLQQMVEVIRAFCWHQIFDPRGLSVPTWDYMHVKKNK